MRSSLELLVLTFVQEGLRTPYELKARGGLSLGSTVPALARLASDGLLRSSKPGARGSRSFEVTEKGLRTLEHDARILSEAPAADSEAVLRTAYLIFKYASPVKAADFLTFSATNAEAMAKVATAEAERFGAATTLVDTAAYRAMRARTDAARLEAEGKVFGKLAAKFRDSKPQKMRRKSDVSRRTMA
jgi:DNA-binding PadR family transcriptional regulator